jgi:hypothetical protein
MEKYRRTKKVNMFCLIIHFQKVICYLIIDIVVDYNIGTILCFIHITFKCTEHLLAAISPLCWEQKYPPKYFAPVKLFAVTEISNPNVIMVDISNIIQHVCLFPLQTNPTMYICIPFTNTEIF